MASYLELRGYVADKESDMHNKMEMAVAVEIARILKKEDTAANGYDDVTANHEKRRTWAANALARARDEAQALSWVVVCAMKELTIAQINGVSVAALADYLKPFITEYAIAKAA